MLTARAITHALALPMAAWMSGCGHASELPQMHLRAGDGPATVLLADFDRDGALDIAVANARSGNVSVYLNNGSRRFSRAPHSPMAAGPSPNDIAVGDFNRDGNPDLAFANHDTQLLTVLVGDGHGSFEPARSSPVHVAVKPHPHGIASGDFNRDGFADLVTDSWAENRLQILFNPGGDRTWKRSTYVGVGKHPYQRIRVADLNRDGFADIVSPNLEGDDVTILLGDGHGRFRQPAGSPFRSGDSPFAVAVGDVNADGILDLAVVNSPSSAAGRPGKDGLTVLLGDGHGAFRAIKGSPFPTERFPNQATIGDLDGDGVNDVLVSLPESDHLAAFYMSRHGALVARKTIRVDGHPKGLAMADLDRDGKSDLVTANESAGTIAVIFGR
jgi:hypothetical protein